MRFVMAPDSFKESMSAAAAAAALTDGVRQAIPDAVCVEKPMSDGGEGMTAVLLSATGGQLASAAARNALGEPVTSHFGLTGDGPAGRGVAVIEAASVIGLELIRPGQRDIMRSNSAGLGDLMGAASRLGATKVLIGLGGTATCDGGAGLLTALGARLYDATGALVEPLPGLLHLVKRVDLSQIRPLPTVQAACDVTNRLLGPDGAAAVFAPQKGATASQVKALEAGLRQFAAALETVTGRGIRDIPGTGAAGGIGAALAALGVELCPGAKLVADVIGLGRAVTGADWVVTGEGSVDGQTLAGKAPAVVAAIASGRGVGCVAFAGRTGPGASRLVGSVFRELIQITPPDQDQATALETGPANLRTAAAAWAGRLATRA
ncbi:MAG: glycerate kinase [Bifidobacteriaceae bacterium]|nr:glycerate kinase [Bifidobacteriaceae bacterium]